MPFSPNITGQNIKTTATAISNELERIHIRAKFFSDQIAKLDSTALTALGLDENYKTYLGSLKSDIDALKTHYDSNSVFIKQFVDLLV